MRKYFLILLFCLASALALAAPSAPEPANQTAWRARLADELPLFGHRNWILIVDSAYPLQVSPGIETIDTGSSQLDVLHAVLDDIARTPHLRPDLFMDAELANVHDADAPGASAYRQQIADLFRDTRVFHRPHETLISTVAQAGAQFHVLVLKTNAAIPYSSVFIQLNCRYWSDDAEQRLRDAIKAAQPR